MKQDFFNSAYTGENTRRDFLNFLRVKLFGDALKENIEPLGINRKTNFFEDSDCFSLGEIQLDKKVSILEMKQKSKNDPRITLTRDAFKIMEDKGMRQALVVFYSADSTSWRFSLLTLKRTWGEKEISDPKRYSFLLGVGEKTKTPERYLSKQVTDFSDLVSRFDVEVVRKEFFNHYLTLYIKLYKAIQADTEFVKLLKSQKVDLVSFTKNLLGKIIFLYFIQKKGWLGVEKGGEFGKDGDKNFMRNFFNNFNDKEKVVWEDTGYFYNDYLEHLFYEGLNKDNRQEDDVSNYFNFRVPYLNGGLFKKDYENWNINKSILSNEVFSNGKDGILDIFDTYNFTIDEDDLYDSDIAVDPEMLGRIFEKMISISSDNIDEIVAIYDDKKKVEIDKELNKKFGAFYTPREIVHYMTKESIIAYLVNNLSGKKEEKEEKIRLLFEYKDKYLTAGDMRQSELNTSFEALGGIIEDVDVALSKVKILDPAVGSGAFPMGILHEVSTIRFYIYDVFYRAFSLDSQLADYLIDGKVSMYKIKREIIQNNIYGVDIEPGAIDIARLRFWLSLVVDEEQPEPLPNFEFKFVCANTLIPLAEVEEQTQMQLEDTKELNVETLRKYMVEYYNTQKNKEKEDMQGQIKGRIEKFLGIGKNTSMDLFNTKSERTKQLETYHPFEKNHSASFFDPSLMMGNSKFDIVIGNPPYISHDRIGGKEIIKKEYKSFEAFADIYCYFYEKAIKLLNQKGNTCFITSNSFLRANYGEKIRNLIIENTTINYLLNLEQSDIFDNAIVDSCILQFSKQKQKTEAMIYNSQLPKDGIFELNIESQKYYYQQNDFNDKFGWTLQSLEILDVRKKIEKDSDTLLKLGAKIRLGIATGDNNAFILDENQKNNLIQEDASNEDIIKPILQGKNINRYQSEFDNKYVLLTKNGINIEADYPTILEYLEKFGDKFKKRGAKGREWYNLRACAFFDDFKEEKIMWIELTDKGRFAITSDEIYLLNSAYFMIPPSGINGKFLLAILNSKIIHFYVKAIAGTSGMGTLRWINNYIKELPIKNISEEKQKPFIEKVDAILEITKQSFYDPKNPPKEQLDLETEIDEMVYELYGLTEEELRVVEESLG